MLNHLSVFAAALGGLAALALPSLVYAEDSFTKENYPQQMNKRPLTLAEGQVEITGDLTLGLDDGAALKRVHLTPDVYYGIDKNLTIGVSHHQMATPWNAAFGRSLCVGEECGEAYSNVSVDVKYTLVRGDFSAALHGGLDIINFDPFGLGVRVGVMMRVRAGETFFLDMDPGVRFGVIGRDDYKEVINLPVRASLQLSKEVAPFVETGLLAPLDGFGDAFAVPLGIGVNVAVDRNLDLGAAVRFPLLVTGVADASGLKAREVGLFAGYRL